MYSNSLAIARSIKHRQSEGERWYLYLGDYAKAIEYSQHLAII
jgi:hypothetical protein